MISRYVLALVAILMVTSFSCKPGRPAPPDVSGIDADISIIRFDSVLGIAHADSLRKLIPSWRRDYAYVVDNDIPDSIYAGMIADFIGEPLIREALRKTSGTFADTRQLEDELSQAFRYTRYYFPEVNIPQVYTYVSGFDLGYAMKYSDTALAIGLDLYLGEGFLAYRSLGIPKYQQKWLIPGQLVRDCMAEVYNGHFYSLPADPSLLDHIVSRGKQLAFISAMVPDMKESQVLKYTEDQWEWSLDHEAEIWSLFISEDLLFSRDQQKTGKFVQPGPFTQGLGERSPSRLADFIGFRMVSRYLEQHGMRSLPKALTIKDAEEMLKASRYKPRR